MSAVAFTITVAQIDTALAGLAALFAISAATFSFLCLLELDDGWEAIGAAVLALVAAAEIATTFRLLGAWP